MTISHQTVVYKQAGFSAHYGGGGQVVTWPWFTNDFPNNGLLGNGNIGWISSARVQ